MYDEFRACERCGISKGPNAFRGPRGRICTSCQANTKRETARKRERYPNRSIFTDKPSEQGQEFWPSEHPNKYKRLLDKLRHARRRSDDEMVAHFEHRLRDEFGWNP